MKKLKKTLSVLLLAALVFACCLPVSLAEELIQTTDASVADVTLDEAIVLLSDEVEEETEPEETTEPEYPSEVETPVEQPVTPAQPEQGNVSEGEVEEEPQYPGDVEESTQDEDAETTPDDENAESGEENDADAVNPDEEQTEVPSEEASDEEQTEVSDEEQEEAPEMTEVPEEETEEELEEEVEEEAPAFAEGYATIGRHTTVYETTSVSSEMGTINAGGAVYVLGRVGDGESDSDWMEILFAGAQNGNVEVMHGYVRARDVDAVAEEEVDSLTAWLSATNGIEHDGWMLQPLSFTANEVVADELVTGEAPEAGEEPELDLNELLDPDRHVVMRANWSGEEVHFGDSLELQAMPVGYDNAIYSLQWQTKAVGGEWQDVEGETDCVFTCEVTEDNYLNQWRVLLTVTGVEIVADAE